MNDDFRAASKQLWSGSADAWSARADELEQGPSGVAARWMLDAVAAGPDACSLGDPQRLRSLLGDFDDVQIELLQTTDRFASADVWWARTVDLAAPLTAALSNLPSDGASEVERRAKEAAGGYVAADGALEFPATALVASAKRPG